MKHKTPERLSIDALRREKQMKSVRIDHKTVIIVNANIPDDEARATFQLRREENERRHSTKQDRTRNAIQKNIKP